MERKYRIKANINNDNVLNVNFKQNIDLYEILSLSISKDSINNLKRENAYKLFSSDYGVIVGRVLANDAFGVPNAKVSIFVPITDEDKLRSDIKNIYPYSFVTDYNKDYIRYNTLPNYAVNECHTPVGTFPSKRLVLDNDNVLEIYDKYYKYTTVTNSAGDYMIFGVPVGGQILHTDIDLSDIGMLSQKPSDFLSKGYTSDMFESSSRFKKSTNLDNLAQIFSENTSVNVYPFWGDKSVDEIAITRKDIRLQYQFETSCVFFGSVITDNPNNSISHKCVPDLKVGDASQLMTSTGKIEMIRKTLDDTVEEYSINSNNLIDSDGVFCYQIPMNLDFVGTDEYGNIVPTDNPKKGIPTRARVRFRITLDETGSEAVTTHKARYLVPNNPDLWDGDVQPYVEKSIIDEDKYYIFGTNTDDDCFRDLYWNKIYSIKNYIPRLQLRWDSEREQNYFAIKGVNKRSASGINPIPYNKLNLNFGISTFYLLYNIKYNKNVKINWKDAWNTLTGNYNSPRYDSIMESIVDETESIGLDFYDDWLNGCLYFPNWYWYSNINDKEFCECKNVNDKNYVRPKEDKVWVVNTGSLTYDGVNFEFDPDNINEEDTEQIQKKTTGSESIDTGVIKKIINKDNAEVFYYAFGSSTNEKKELNGHYKYARLFSTDIILIGSVVDDDFHGIPKLTKALPSTTCTIPPLGIFKEYEEKDDDESENSILSLLVENNTDDELFETDNISYNGMNWGTYWYDGRGVKPGENGYEYKFQNGLFFAIKKIQYPRILNLILFEKEIFIDSIGAAANEKTYPNVERICELGVTNDSNYRYVSEQNSIDFKMDGFITRREIEDNDIRSFFATLNSNKLIGEKDNGSTGYKKYNLYYIYPTNFDGRLEKVIENFTNGEVSDIRNKDYIDFRMGSVAATSGIYNKHYYYSEDGQYAFPLYNNSFYFYFGLNPGKTAVDKLYGKYLESCIVTSAKNSFSIYATISDATYCNDTANIKVNVDGYVTFPIVVYLYGNSVNLNSGHIYSTPYTFSNIGVGNYKITVVDSYNLTVEENIKVLADPIKLNVSKASNITTDYDEGVDVCENKGYGVIEIESYKKDGDKIDIISLENESLIEDGKKLKYKVNGEEHILLEINADNDSIANSLCSDDENGYIFDENGVLTLRVKRPDKYRFKLYNDEYASCDDFSYETLTVTASDDLDMLINGISIKYFGADMYTGRDVEDVSDVLAWANVNDPNKYNAVFNNDNVSDAVSVWDTDNVQDIVSRKIKALFDISNAVYVTNKEGTFNVTTSGDDVLLRSGHPSYDGMNKYALCNTGDVTVRKGEANIIPNDDYSEYVFNPIYDYNDYSLAGNFYACFDKNAEIDPTTCEKTSNTYSFSKMPLNTSELYRINAPGTGFENFCTDTDIEKTGLNYLPEEVYKNTANYKPYFRTEFIDRRLGYDLIYITQTLQGNSNNVWNKARLSGITYNGIEMAYDNNRKLVSQESNEESITEYTYSNIAGKMYLQDNEKYFFESIITVNRKSVDIREAYKYKQRIEPTVNSDKVSVISHDYSDIDSDEYGNFGFNDNKPTKRLLDINMAAVAGEITNDPYSFKLTTCGYSNSPDINVTAEPGEIVIYDLHNSMITFNPGNYTISCGYSNGKATSTALTLNLVTNLYGGEEFSSYAFIQDDYDHNEYNKLKSEVFDISDLHDQLTAIPSDGKLMCGLAEGKSSLDGYVGLVLYKELVESESHPIKRLSVYDVSKIYKVVSFNLTYSKQVKNVTNSADVPAGSVVTQGVVVIDGHSYNITTSNSNPIDSLTESNTYVNININGFTNSSTIDRFATKIVIDGITVGADYDGGDGNYTIPCGGINRDANISSLEAWVTINNIKYYIRVV